MGYIRDLRGIKTKDGKYIRPTVLLRSAQLNNPSKTQIQYLKDIGLKRIIDLRNEAEAEYDPDISLDNNKYYNISLIDSNLNGITHEKKFKQLIMLKQMPTVEQTYVKMVEDDYSLKAIKKVIRLIVLEHDYPTVVHCVTGKDRAGLIIALILYMLNVDYETIVLDYLKQRPYYMSKARKYGVIAFAFTLNKSLAKKAYDYYALNRICIDKSFEAIRNNFGSVDKFISDYLELSQKDIAEFRDIILCEEQA